MQPASLFLANLSTAQKIALGTPLISTVAGVSVAGIEILRSAIEVIRAVGELFDEANQAKDNGIIFRCDRYGCRTYGRCMTKAAHHLLVSSCWLLYAVPFLGPLCGRNGFSSYLAANQRERIRKANLSETEYKSEIKENFKNKKYHDCIQDTPEYFIKKIFRSEDLFNECELETKGKSLNFLLLERLFSAPQKLFFPGQSLVDKLFTVNYSKGAMPVCVANPLIDRSPFSSSQVITCYMLGKLIAARIKNKKSLPHNIHIAFLQAIKEANQQQLQLGDTRNFLDILIYYSDKIKKNQPRIPRDQIPSERERIINQFPSKASNNKICQWAETIKKHDQMSAPFIDGQRHDENDLLRMHSSAAFLAAVGMLEIFDSWDDAQAAIGEHLKTMAN